VSIFLSLHADHIAVQSAVQYEFYLKLS